MKDDISRSPQRRPAFALSVAALLLILTACGGRDYTPAEVEALKLRCGLNKLRPVAYRTDLPGGSIRVLCIAADDGLWWDAEDLIDPATDQGH